MKYLAPIICGLIAVFVAFILVQMLGEPSVITTSRLYLLVFFGVTIGFWIYDRIHS